MRILVTGASGYIGSSVARAFARAGHDVQGLVRSAEKGKALVAAEVTPVIGSMQDSAPWATAARECQVLVHCAAESSPRSWDLDRATMQLLLESAAQTRRERVAIYTSGVWVYGDTGDLVVDESSELHPIDLVHQRVDIEQMVLRASAGALRTLVLRPGCVYGGAGGMTGQWFASASERGAARVVGEARWAMIHVEDLAKLYVRAAESGLGGEVFNATDRSRNSVAECAAAASRAARGEAGVEVLPLEAARKRMGPFADALALVQHVDSSKAVRRLGWQPRHAGFVDGAPRYFAAWQASRA